jgi:hypothetical protein
MLFYLPACACVATFFIFRSVGIDYRLIALGSLIPFAIDIALGHASLGHSFLLPVVALVIIMVGTIGQKRLLRRQLLCLVIGIFFSDVFEGTFLHQRTWWWPLNVHHESQTLSILPSWGWWIARDVIGLILIYVFISLGDLYQRDKWQKFVSTGRVTT